MNFEIKHRSTDAVLFSLECASFKLCVEAAIRAGAYLTGADLRGADLTGAYLRGAYLRGADLTGADLRDADLTGANLKGADLKGADLKGADLRDADLTGAYLTGADLRDADLRDADLTRADLSGADLRDADLRDADLTRADLSGADLRDANLTGANLTGANLTGAKGDFATTEESDAMLARIADIVLATPERLEMGGWHGLKWDATHTPEEEHSCGTAHCLAGWAQALCPLPLVRRMEPVRAGMMLIPTAAHMFYASNEAALEFLKSKSRQTLKPQPEST